MHLHFGILKVGQSMAQLLDFRLFMREPVVYRGRNANKNRKGREILGNQLFAQACCLLPKKTREQTWLSFRAGEQFCPQKSPTYSLQSPTKGALYICKRALYIRTKALYLRKRALCIRKRAQWHVNEPCHAVTCG